MKNILDKYKELTFTVEDDTYHVSQAIHQYDILKSYFDGEKSKEDTIDILAHEFDCPEGYDVIGCNKMTCSECWEKVINYKYE